MSVYKLPNNKVNMKNCCFITAKTQYKYFMLPTHCTEQMEGGRTKQTKSENRIYDRARQTIKNIT